MARAPFVRDGRWIRDARGRVRIFHGVNVSGRTKMPPFVPFEDPAPLDRLQTWGFNVLRLLVIWEALEPERGAVDEDYLARISAIVEAAAARGLYVVVDIHQDLYARSLGGDGAPAWAVKHHGTPACGRNWFLHYARSTAVQRSFAAFWADEDGLRTAYLATVRALVRWMNRHDNVIGYDLFNEPMTALAAVASGRFERETLRDFHADCARVLEGEADGAPRLQLIEPTPIVAFGLPCRLQHRHGPSAVFAPHLYDALAITTGRYRRRFSNAPKAVATLAAWARRHDMPLFIGEFGALNGVGAADAMLEDQCQRLDRHFASWTAWHYDTSGEDWNDEGASIVDPHGGERPFTGALIRPYPTAIAGTPVRLDSRPPVWTLAYEASGSAPTEIVVPPRWSASPEIEVDGGSVSTAEPSARVSVEAAAGAKVTLRIRRTP
ncbi:MAG: cellulase family glycosylhydrolase [Myxococcota bacterium]